MMYTCGKYVCVYMFIIYLSSYTVYVINNNIINKTQQQ